MQCMTLDGSKSIINVMGKQKRYALENKIPPVTKLIVAAYMTSCLTLCLCLFMKLQNIP